MKVFNKRDKDIPLGAIYVGRPSKWGNPMTVKELKILFPRDSSAGLHQRAVDWYKRYLPIDVRLYEQLDELRGKDLVCWCAPLPCHADVLIEMANRE